MTVAVLQVGSDGGLGMTKDKEKAADTRYGVTAAWTGLGGEQNIGNKGKRRDSFLS